MVHQHLHTPSIQVNDITTAFRAAAAGLKTGQLVKDEYFTLFEAVSALEIAWHMGYPLSQTIFTSVHIEDLLWPEPKTLDDARFNRSAAIPVALPALLVHVFRPFCLALIKSCDLVLSMVASQHYYEEEDFATQIFNRPLLHEVAVDDVLLVLESAQSQLHVHNLTPELSSAIAARLDVRRSFLLLLRACSNATAPDTAHLGDPQSMIEVVKRTALLGSAVTSEAFTLKIQRRLASSVPPRPMVVFDHAESFDFLQRLFLDSMHAFEIFQVSCSVDLLVAYQCFMSQTPQPAVYVRALVQSFLSVRGDVLGRVPVQQFVFQDLRPLVAPNYVLTIEDGLFETRLTTEQMQVVSQLNHFAHRSGPSFVNLFRTFCLNRCRLRRTMCHAALEWDQIQAEAEELDALYQSAFNEKPRLLPGSDEPTFSYALSSWVYHHKLGQLQSILQIGFELSIYAPHEYVQTLWHLASLSNNHLSHLDRISFFISLEGRLTTVQQQNIQSNLRYLYRQFAWLKATEALAKALHGLLVVLRRHGHMVQPKLTYSTDRLRYELRMRPFHHLSIPEPVPAEIAQQACLLEGFSDLAVLEQASKANQAAKKAWDEVLKGGWHFQSLLDNDDTKPSAPVLEREWTQRVRSAIKACIGTGIAITTLVSMLRLKNSLPLGLKVQIPEVGHRDRWHAAWPVPKILI